MRDIIHQIILIHGELATSFAFQRAPTDQQAATAAGKMFFDEHWTWFCHKTTLWSSIRNSRLPLMALRRPRPSTRRAGRPSAPKCRRSIRSRRCLARSTRSAKEEAEDTKDGWRAFQPKSASRTLFLTWMRPRDARVMPYS